MNEALRVIANFRSSLAVKDLPGVDGESRIVKAIPLRQLPLVVTGDRVRIERDGGAVRATALEARTSVLERPGRHGRHKPLAANLTHLGIVSAAPPGIDTLLIDQFCVAADRGGIDAIVIVNKVDLLDPSDRADVDAMLEGYRSAGYPAVATDAKRDDGLETLEHEIAGRAIALVGASGVGKSSIVQRLMPDIDVRIGELSRATGIGAHTTSVTFWYDRPDGGAIVDSPGVRQFAVDELDPADVRAGFREIAAASAGCRFNDCVHTVEPGCAVREAVADGSIARFRYANYRKLAGV